MKERLLKQRLHILEPLADGRRGHVQALRSRPHVAGVGQRQGQARQGAVDEGSEGGGDSIGGNQHAGIMQGAGGAYVLPGARNGTVATASWGVPLSPQYQSKVLARRPVLPR